MGFPLELCDAFFYLSTEILQKTSQVTIFHLVACILELFEHCLVALCPVGMIESPKLQLLLGGPEMRNQKLTREKVPECEQDSQTEKGTIMHKHWSNQ